MNGYAEAAACLPSALQEVLLPGATGNCRSCTGNTTASGSAGSALHPAGRMVCHSGGGRITPRPSEDTLRCGRAQLSDCFQILCDFSVHTHQQELRQGFIAVKNGCRAGVARTAVVENRQILSLRNVTSLCLPGSAPSDGCARELSRLLALRPPPTAALLRFAAP